MIENERDYKKFDVVYCDLSNVVGSEQGGVRPAIIISNDVGNKYSPTVIIVPLTSKQYKHNIPTHTAFMANNGIVNTVLAEQLRCVDKKRIKKFLYRIDDKQLQNNIDNVIKKAFFFGEG